MTTTPRPLSLVWPSGDDPQWFIDVTFNAAGRPIGMTIERHPLAPPEIELTAAVVRRLPVDRLIRSARASVPRRAVLEEALSEKAHRLWEWSEVYAESEREGCSGVTALMNYAKVSESTVMRALNKMRAKGWAEPARNPGRRQADARAAKRQQNV